MATLILSTVGSALGGPIGGAIGSIVGQSIDQQLFGPPMRRGPRLGDLTIQTSSYGTPIPKIYGAMRIAGTVIWATDLKEEQSVQGGGKSGDYVAYSYSVSMAVALSARAATRVGRIWADGKLLRGVAGDFKVGTKFRFYPGSEDQPIDPLIAAIETVANTPAYRGLAVAVFEDLHLADFGNRIPVLTFELFGDEGDVDLADLLDDVGGGAIVADRGRHVGGYAAHGRSIADAVEALTDLFDIRLRDGGGILREADGSLATCLADEQNCSLAGEPPSRLERDREDGNQLPRSLTISYYEQARDYQTSLARAASGGTGRHEMAIELPATLIAAQGKPLAQALLSRRWIGRDRLRLALSPDRLSVTPGDRLAIEGIEGIWLVTRAAIEGFVVSVDTRRIAGAASSGVADGGRAALVSDQSIGPTQLAVFELGGAVAGAAGFQLLVAASNSGAFRPVAVDLSIGNHVAASVAVRRKTPIGVARTLLGQGSSLLRDNLNSVEVELVDPAVALVNVDEDGLAMGGNLALIGNELLQFATAAPIGPRLYRLSGLWRGRRGTEWATAGHGVGDTFVMIDPASLVAVELDPMWIGGQLLARPLGVADRLVVPIARIATGESRLPVAPAHLSAERSDTLTVRWQSRNAGWWGWNDLSGNEVDPATTYAVSVRSATGQVALECAGSTCSFTASALAVLGGGEWTVVVNAVSTNGRSRPITLKI